MHSCCSWRSSRWDERVARDGGLRMDQARRLKELETENGRLKNLVADLNLDKSILEEALRGNF